MISMLIKRMTLAKSHNLFSRDLRSIQTWKVEAFDCTKTSLDTQLEIGQNVLYLLFHINSSNFNFAASKKKTRFREKGMRKQLSLTFIIRVLSICSKFFFPQMFSIYPYVLIHSFFSMLTLKFLKLVKYTSIIDFKPIYNLNFTWPIRDDRLFNGFFLFTYLYKKHNLKKMLF